MKVEFETALSDQGAWDSINMILYRILEGAHEWAIVNSDLVEESAWLENNSRFREVFEKIIVDQSFQTETAHTKKLVVCNNPTNSAQLNPKDAFCYLDRPVVIIVENRSTDGLLLNTAIEHLAPGPIRELISSRIRNIIEIDSGGGIGEIPKIIKYHLQRAQRDGVPLRAVVFADSDSQLPGPISKNSQNVKDVCLQQGIPCYILEKRCIENYIPDEIFSAMLPPHGTSSKIEAFLALTPEQRDYFDVKHGFKNFSMLPANLKTFYGSLTEGQKSALEKGFSDKIINSLDTYKDELTPEGIRYRDHKGELEIIIQLIANEL